MEHLNIKKRLQKEIESRERVQQSIKYIKDMSSSLFINDLEVMSGIYLKCTSVQPLKSNKLYKSILDFDTFSYADFIEPKFSYLKYIEDFQVDIVPHLTYPTCLDQHHEFSSFNTLKTYWNVCESEPLEHPNGFCFDDRSQQVIYPLLEREPLTENIRHSYIYAENNSLYEALAYALTHDFNLIRYSYKQIEAFKEYLSKTLRRLERNIRLLIKCSRPITSFDKRFGFRKIMNFLFKNLDDAHSTVNKFFATLKIYLTQNKNEQGAYQKYHYRHPGRTGFAQIKLNFC